MQDFCQGVSEGFRRENSSFSEGERISPVISEGGIVSVR